MGRGSGQFGMPLPSETVSLPGSGLVFVNTYSDTVSADYRGAVIAAENQLQSHFTDAITFNVAFDYRPLSGAVAQNTFLTVSASYAQFVAALSARASSPDDGRAVAGLPAGDPTGGHGMTIPWAQAMLLGLGGPFAGPIDTVTLNSTVGYTFGQDAVGSIEHELTE